MNDLPTFEDFMLREARRLWRGKHLAETKAKLVRFSTFRDYGSRRLDDFKPADIYRFSDHLQDEGLSDNTINHYFAAISSVFKHGVEMELITHAPKIKWFKVRSGRPRFLSDAEITKLDRFLSNHPNNWMAHFVTISLNTGMRLGEILKITPDDVSQTDDGWWVELRDTKNGDDRSVPLNKQAFEALKALDLEPVKHYSHRRFYNTWAEARRAIAKNDVHFVFHILRHTAATNMANNLRVPSNLIAMMLGHRSERTTAKYVHAKAATLQDIAKQMGR